MALTAAAIGIVVLFLVVLGIITVAGFFATDGVDHFGRLRHFDDVAMGCRRNLGVDAEILGAGIGLTKRGGCVRKGVGLVGVDTVVGREIEDRRFVLRRIA